MQNKEFIHSCPLAGRCLPEKQGSIHNTWEDKLHKHDDAPFLLPPDFTAEHDVTGMEYPFGQLG